MGICIPYRKYQLAFTKNRLPEVSPPDWDDLYYESYVVLDILGNRMAVHDARGLMPHVYSYNMLKSVVRQVSLDSGTQYMLVEGAGQPLCAWDADMRLFHFTYDARCS